MNILTANFTILLNCPMHNYFRCQPTAKAQMYVEENWSNDKMLID